MDVMPGWNGLERRKNPCSAIVRDWRRALQDEWEADRHRRETHRSDEEGGPGVVQTSGAKDGIVGLAGVTDPTT
jgi:hypothetical protein